MALWERVRTSLWFLPTLMLAGGAFLAWIALDVQIEADASGFIWWLNQGSAQEAGRLLSALLGSLITMATLVISITIVVLTLAAGQLGPRLIRSFVGDRRTQAVIGFFIGTVVYILLIFRLLDSDLPKEAVPHFAVTMASVLVFLCLITLLFYINHLSRSIVADTVVNRVGDELDSAIRANLPGSAVEIPTLVLHRPNSAAARYRSPQSGYIETLDYEGLARKAGARGALVELQVRPGHHVLKDRTLALVWPSTALDDALQLEIGAAIGIGRERTPVQDIEFSVRQLVEVALRALSPGINDTFTAIAVIDRLSASIALAMEMSPARRYWNDGEGQVRVVAEVSTFAGLVDIAFNQIRQAAAGQVAVLIRLLEVLTALSEGAGGGEHEAVLHRHRKSVILTARASISHRDDLAALEAQYRHAGGETSEA